MTAKNNVTTSAVATPSVLDMLRAQLAEAQKGIAGSEKIEAELKEAEAKVVAIKTQLAPFAQAKVSVRNIQRAIDSLEGKAIGGLGGPMSEESKRKLSETHKKLWAAKKEAAAKAGVTLPKVGERKVVASA